MQRKDCETKPPRAVGSFFGPRSVYRSPAIQGLVLGLTAMTAPCLAGTVRLWASAVVVDETVRLDDVCELSGFDRETERKLAEITVSHAPEAGGSRIIHLELVRGALRAGGANMATVTLKGATTCAITRPATPIPQPRTESARPRQVRSASGSAPGSVEPRKVEPGTLRQAVIDYFNAELARYGGQADVVFHRTSQQVLDLSGPTYEFRIRRRGRVAIGAVKLEIDVIADGKPSQTIPLDVQVSMFRRVMVARRAINQNAPVGPVDVEPMRLSFSRLTGIGVENAASVVGQRAKRFIPAGTMIDPSMLEPVPLVRRGEFVRVSSITGSVRVVLSGTALQSGFLGDTVTVRTVDNKRVEFDAVVVGPGQVQIGGRNAVAGADRVATRGGS